MGDYTAAERIARFRERRQKAGLVETRLWVRPATVPLLRVLAAHPDVDQVLSAAMEIIRTGQAMALKQASPAPAGADEILPDDPCEFGVRFKNRPPSEVRNLLKEHGIRPDSTGRWQGIVTFQQLRKLMPVVKNAGGFLNDPATKPPAGP